MKFFSLIYQGEVHPADEEKVIPAEDFSTLMDAKQILERAHAEIADYRKEVQQECDRLKEEAKEAGYQEGLTRFDERLIQFDRQINTLRMELQKQLLPLALKAAKKIVTKELETHPETIVDIVLQTMQPAIQNHRFTIYVSRADREILEANKPKIKAILEQVQILNVQERADIAPGGCIIETESGIINATIENQWRALEAAFEKFSKLA